MVEEMFTPLPLDKKRGGSKLSAIALFIMEELLKIIPTRSRTMGDG